MHFKPLSVSEYMAQISPFPDGDYHLIITEVTKKVSSSGQDMLDIEYVHKTSKGNSLKIHDYIMPNHEKMGWKFYQLCESVGLLDKYKAGLVTEIDLKGKRVKAVIKTKPNEKAASGVQSSIVRYNVISESDTAQQQSPPSFVDDNIPF